MALATDIYHVVGEKARFTLHRGQARAWRSNARFVFAIAGTQGGKTSFVPVWLDREINNCGPGDYLAVTASYDLFKLKFLPEMRRYFVSLQGWHEDKSDRVLWRKEKNDEIMTRIILRSAQSEGGLESATVKAAVLDECGQDDFRVDSWEAVQRRLSLSQGRVLGTTTPYNLGWLKSEVFDRWRVGDPDYFVTQFRSIENPAFPLAEYERMKRTLPAWKFEMFYNGNFTRPAGMIYGDLSDDQFIDPIELKPEWPRFVGIDPGPVHTAIVWFALDPEKNIYYLYLEYLKGDKTTHEHATEAKRLSQGVNVFRWALGQKSEKQYRLDWTAEGLPVKEPTISDVEGGIDRVIALIKEKRLYVFKTCTGTKDQFGIYSRVLDKSGQVTNEIKDKEKFHFLDAVRYAVISFTSGVAGVDFAG